MAVLMSFQLGANRTLALSDQQLHHQRVLSTLTLLIGNLARETKHPGCLSHYIGWQAPTLSMQVHSDNSLKHWQWRFDTDVRVSVSDDPDQTRFEQFSSLSINLKFTEIIVNDSNLLAYRLVFSTDLVTQEVWLWEDKMAQC